MSLTRIFRALVLPLAPWLAAAGLALPARAGDGCCGGNCGGGCPATCCGPGIFCPVTKFCQIRPPCIKWKCTCPKPVCDPCNLDHYGYYPTCWHAWPFPPDYTCCRLPPNGVVVDQLLGQPEPVLTPPPSVLPVPRRLNGNPQ
jgi:hypothetical protein